MNLEQYIPVAKARYEAYCELLREEADQDGRGRKHVHCLPFDQFPEDHQLSMAAIIRDRYAKETE